MQLSHIWELQIMNDCNGAYFAVLGMCALPADLSKPSIQLLWKWWQKYHIYGHLRQPLLLYSSISQKQKCSEILRHFACRTFKQSHAVLCCAVHVNADKFAMDTRVLWSTKGMAHARVLTWARTAGCGCQAGQTRCQDNAVRASQCEEVLIKHLHNKLKLPASRERSLRSSLTY